MDTPTWPSSALVAVTPLDATVYNPPLRQLYVGATGDVIVETEAGTAITFKAVPTGAFIGPFFIKKVKTASTATFIVGFY